MSDSATPDSVVPDAIEGYAVGTVTPGIAAAVIYQGQPYYYNYGFAIENDPDVPITLNTIFEIGSVTKLFTSTLLAYNLQMNPTQWSLDDPVTAHLPPLGNVNTLSQVTLGQLVTHTSGMPDEGGGLAPSYFLFNQLPPTETLETWWRAFAGTPGQCWLYSSIAFVTAGFCVGLFKQPDGSYINQYNQLLSQLVTEPLGMGQTASYILPPGGPVAQGYVGAYDTNAKQYSIAADLKSSAQDMATFMLASMNLIDVSAMLAAALAHTQTVIPAPTQVCGNPNQNNPFQMGMAWQISNAGQSDELLVKNGAVGGSGGFMSWVGIMPQLGLGITLLANKFVQGPIPSTQTKPLALVGRSILQQLQ